MKTNAYQAFQKNVYQIRLTKINSQYLSYKNLFSKMAQICQNKAIHKCGVMLQFLESLLRYLYVQGGLNGVYMCGYACVHAHSRVLTAFVS